MPALRVCRLVRRAQLLRVGRARLVRRLPRRLHIPARRLQLLLPASQLCQQRAVIHKLWHLGQLLRLPDELESKVGDGDVAARRCAAAIPAVMRGERLRGWGCSRCGVWA